MHIYVYIIKLYSGNIKITRVLAGLVNIFTMDSCYLTEGGTHNDRSTIYKELVYGWNHNLIKKYTLHVYLRKRFYEKAINRKYNKA